jgi:RNA:NAD 2'-phosphotransferase (TPT1/KptA family)
MRRTREFQQFDKAMSAILRADPRAVKVEMDAEMNAHAEERAARGERKRGRKKAANKRPSASAPASSAKGD